ncbi:MAG: aspartate/glutamate racemase family protein [Gammaproteobacteria bacterium]|nr:aspartate/glutamate racemase family protein [Pseudomonadales bacterium]MCP5349070.1 aspartate/glutamate racemase family protein [Pseudomonadales bacterium]
MKTIGLLGGMSWESTIGYYRAINQGVKEALGGLHSASIVLVSVDFQPLEELQRAGDWEQITNRLVAAARQVEHGGANMLLICTNTMHKVAPAIEDAIRIPLLHIADATAEVINAAGISRVGLLGTAFTMEQDFYKGRLQEKFAIEVIVPEQSDRELVHGVIYQELCLGRVTDQSRREYLRIIDQLARDGAQAVILGCTEIGLLISQQDTSVKLFDTTAIHARKAVENAL